MTGITNRCDICRENKQIIAEYLFNDNSRLTIVCREKDRKVRDEMIKYIAPFCEYYDSDGKYQEKQSLYLHTYKIAIRVSEYISETKNIDKLAARKIVFRPIYKIFSERKEINSNEKEEVDLIINQFIEKNNIEPKHQNVFRKLYIKAYFDFYAEDNMLYYQNTMFKFGRKLNCGKIYLALFRKTEFINFIKQIDMETWVGHINGLWNKDDKRPVEEKNKEIEATHEEIEREFGGQKSVDDYFG